MFWLVYIISIFINGVLLYFIYNSLLNYDLDDGEKYDTPKDKLEMPLLLPIVIALIILIPVITTVINFILLILYPRARYGKWWEKEIEI